MLPRIPGSIVRNTAEGETSSEVAVEDVTVRRRAAAGYQRKKR